MQTIKRCPPKKEAGEEVFRRKRKNGGREYCFLSDHNGVICGKLYRV